MENYNFDEQVTPYTGARFVLVDAEDIFSQNNAQKRSVGAPKVIEPAPHLDSAVGHRHAHYSKSFPSHECFMAGTLVGSCDVQTST